MPATNSAPEATDRRDRLRWCFGIAVFALGVRAIHLWALRDSPLIDVLIGDALAYTTWAREIAAGDWLGREVFYQAPLYPYFLAVVHTAVGDGALAVRAVQITLGAVSCGLLAAAGWGFFGRRAGVAAGLLLAVYMPAIFADSTIQKSVLDLLGMSALLWILSGVAEQPRPGRCVALGAVLAALVLSRENALVFAAVLAPWLLWRARSSGSRRFAPALLFLLGMTAVLGPVGLRNAYVGGGFHLTTSQLGPNFYIGNNPAADGTYGPLRAGRGDAKYEREDAKAIAEASLGRALSPAEVSRFFLDRAFDYIASRPADWLRLLGRKTALAFNAVELVDTEDPYTYAESSPVLRLTGVVFHFGVLAPIALFGVFCTWRDRSRLLPLYAMFVVFTASLIVFYVVGRYRLPLAPILILFAAAGVVDAPRFCRSEPSLRVAAAAATGVVAAVFCNWPFADVATMRSVTHYNLGNELAARERTDDAIEQYRTAIRLFGGNALATHNLGVMLARQGDLAGARAQFERALVLRPGYSDAHINLARMLQETGFPEEAIGHFEAGLRSVPPMPGVWFELGRAYADAGRPGSARACFEAVLRLDPTHEEARRALAASPEGSAPEPAFAASVCVGDASG